MRDEMPGARHCGPLLGTTAAGAAGIAVGVTLTLTVTTQSVRDHPSEPLPATVQLTSERGSLRLGSFPATPRQADLAAGRAMAGPMSVARARECHAERTSLREAHGEFVERIEQFSLEMQSFVQDQEALVVPHPVHGLRPM